MKMLRLRHIMHTEAEANMTNGRVPKTSIDSSVPSPTLGSGGQNQVAPGEDLHPTKAGLNLEEVDHFQDQDIMKILLKTMKYHALRK